MKTAISSLTWVKLCEYERVRLFSSEFMDHELPAVQIYDIGEQSVNQQGRDIITWSLAVELVMKKNVDGLVNQGELFQRRLEIKQAIGADPTLGLQSPGVPASEGSMIHVRYAGGMTDLHVLDQHYLARLEFQVMFEEPFSSAC
jgi:hypothetical protein